jgi:glycosyltransferase involved in cell wall biosynthesis
MDILFIGQRGIPATGNSRAGTAEQRVEALAVQLTRAGHRVAVTCARGFTPSSLVSYNGVELLHGRFSRLLSLIRVWRRQPTVVHAHEWDMGALLPLARMLSPASTFMWTVESFPGRWSRFFTWLAQRAARTGVVVTTPSRSLQYRLLSRSKVRATYVPDGYVPTSLDGPVTRFGVRKRQYTLVFSNSQTDLSWIAEAYKASGTRKKLVVMENPRVRRRFSKRRYPFLNFIGQQQGRALMALVRNAAVVILAADAQPEELVLQSMDMKRPLIALTHSRYESILGTCARYVRQGNSQDLTNALAAVITHKKAQKVWGNTAHQRATTHFQWSRIVADYISLYRSPTAYRVALDSVRRTSFTQLASTSLKLR